MKKLISAAAFCFLVAGPAQAQSRVATVNLEILSNPYWKTGLMREALKTKARTLDQTNHQRVAESQ